MRTVSLDCKLRDGTDAEKELKRAAIPEIEKQELLDRLEKLAEYKNRLSYGFTTRAPAEIARFGAGMNAL